MSDMEEEFMIVKISCSAWSKNNYGMYDYKKSNEDDFNDYTLLVSNTENFLYFQDSKIINESYKGNGTELCYFEFDVKNQQVFLQPLVNYEIFSKTELSHYPYIIVDNDNGYDLNKEQILNLGRHKFHLRDLVLDDNFESSPYYYASEVFKAKYKLFSNIRYRTLNELDIECKICRESFDSPENPLFNICKCSGGMKFIHYMCLQRWLEYNEGSIRVAEGVFTFRCKRFFCEICKVNYPCIYKSLNHFSEF